MNTKYIFGMTVVVGILGFILTSSVAYGQTISCVDLNVTISLGSTDARTKGEVSKVQNFLYAQKYLMVTSTGYFGAMSQSAVRKFQGNNGIPVTGTVGPLTRAKIKQISCTSASLPSSSANKTMQVSSGESKDSAVGTPSIDAIKITSMTPNQGKGGETITVFGSGFTPDTVVNYRKATSTNGGGQIGGKNITFVSSNELRFYLDSRHVANSQSGNQFFYLSNSKGASNFLNFTFADDYDVAEAKQASIRANGSLSIGAIGADVVEVQDFLEQKGFLTIPPGGSKGTYDQNTKDAVAKYQASKGIYPADGMVGPSTRATMTESSKNFATVPTSSRPMSVIAPAGITYKNTDSAFVKWTPYGGDFDKYYIMLGNKVAGFSVNLVPDITITKYVTEFTVPLADAYRSIITNRGNYSVEEMQNAYRIEIYADKGGSFSRPEQRAIGETFAIMNASPSI